MPYPLSLSSPLQCRQTLITHWGWVTHICVSKLTIIGSDNGLLPGRRQPITWINAGILLIKPLGTNFNEILIGNIFIQENVFESVVCEMAAILSRPQCVKDGHEEVNNKSLLPKLSYNPWDFCVIALVSGHFGSDLTNACIPWNKRYNIWCYGLCQNCCK